jgi:hypothetical protein
MHLDEAEEASHETGNQEQPPVAGQPSGEEPVVVETAEPAEAPVHRLPRQNLRKRRLPLWKRTGNRH